MLAVASNRRIRDPRGTTRVDQPHRRLCRRRAWQRLSAGAGAKDHRFYYWALAPDPQPTRRGEHWLLVRRNDRTGELAFYRAYSPQPVPLAALVRVAGQRWRVEESFQTGKGLTGLDQHQVRRWTSWHRWATLAMLAHAFLTVITAADTRRPTPRRPG